MVRFLSLYPVLIQGQRCLLVSPSPELNDIIVVDGPFVKKLGKLLLANIQERKITAFINVLGGKQF